MAATAVAAALSAPAWAEPCAPAQVTPDPAGLPDPWRRALEALVRATTHEGHPWSCTGARISLTLEGPHGPARLAVTMNDAAPLERTIAAPEDLVPVGEALLARPLDRPAPLVPPPPAPVVTFSPTPVETVADRGMPAHTPPAGPPAEPRILLDVLGSTRYSSGSAVWVGGALRASLPFDSWSVGIWGRFEAAVAELSPVPTDFILTSGSVGLSAGHRFVARPVELTAAFEPSLAIVSMDGGPDGTPLSATGAKADFRLGTRLQAAVPFGPRWRGLFAMDGEIAPISLASAKHRIINPLLPPIPTFTLGASLGGELALR